MPVDPRRVKELFLAALDLVDPAERAAWLDRECGDDAELRLRLDELLAAHDRPLAAGGTEATLDPAAERTGSFAVRSEPPASLIGSVIAGRYKLRQAIGEGGMGTVYLAEQIQPVKRQVALKLIKTGMDSHTVLARFEQERQALALMDHPHIAKVLDAGTTEQGRSFFVMELVKGIPLTDYCDQHRLGLPERLTLFRQICSAVQHAHQKGIIHRDLKPTNILVESHDGHPVPKVIDFGLAKATSGLQLSEHSLYSAFGSVAGTPLYMAPEQATFNAVDVDTRADIYALGVILYELLTGSTPIPRDTFKKATLDEMLRIVREDEPPVPSSRISSSEALPSIAARRHVEPARLGRFVRGDLDWIVMKTLAKERSRRYDSAVGLANDLERFLNHEPISAGPPSALYRARKFVRRNRGQVVAASLVLLALLAGIAGTTWGYVRAERRAEGERQAKIGAQKERDKALAAEKAERAARQREEAERKYAQAIADFVRDDFLALTSVEGQTRFGEGVGNAGLSKDTTLRELLDRAAGKLRERRDLDPRTEAELNWIIGVNYRGQGEAERALPYLERCVALRRELLGPEDPGTLGAQNSLAVAYGAAGQLDRALPLSEEVVALMKAKHGPDHPDTLTSMNNLATAYLAAGRLDRALPLFEEVLALRKAKLGPDHPNTLVSMNNLALAYQDTGQIDRALPLSEEVLSLMKAKLGPDHPNTLTSMGNLALAYQAAGQLDRALPLSEEVLSLRKAKLGPDHPDTLTSMNTLARGYWLAKRLDRSIPLFEEALKLTTSRFGTDHPDTWNVRANLGVNYKDAGRLDEAILLLEGAFRASREHAPLERWVMAPLADAYARAGRTDEAAMLFKEALEDGRKSLPAGSLQLAALLAQTGSSLLAAKARTEAEPLLRESLRIREQAEPDLWTTFNTRSMLGGAFLGQGKADEAEPLLRDGYMGMKTRADKIPPEGKPRLTDALDRLIAWAEAAGKPDEATHWRAEREEFEKENPTPADGSK